MPEAKARRKNQHEDLPEWLGYHEWLGVSHFYIMDDQSDPPLDQLLQPYIERGLVTHRRLEDGPTMAGDLKNRTCMLMNPDWRQLCAYNMCLHDHGHKHQFMSFTDIDEFLVITDSTPDLPTLLQDYEGYGGVAANWRSFGSSGFKQRQPSTLSSYISCLPINAYGAHTQIKSIVNMAHAVRLAGVHHASYAPGYFAVTASGQPVLNETHTSAPDYSRLALLHYVVKSREDFANKVWRGDAMKGPGKGELYWKKINDLSTVTCFDGLHAEQRWRGNTKSHSAASY
ncbi:hypothetical protein C2E20_5985 [Micractinium conductrix]|uniref:Glycosyltransferase family 92 protein n=1 Tax=Micractinium conductrix TaxID=554055 RepID=A0A2P6V8V6_9CHLO|nr:hypothetical protein C2E20_5985 [Micractinium conductrix]|eukprot:PSC70518.1 hypothetical protein C2E20_5985 [Micractinium conductrix]